VPKTAEANTLLVDGIGQGNNGMGAHDAWTGVPYSRLTQARITAVQFSASGFTATGDGAGAYDAKTGLTKWQRTLTLKAGKLTVSDSIEDTKPSIFTEFLHSDTTVKEVGPHQFLIEVSNIALHSELIAPVDAVAKVESNVVMGPGKPGSVDKGTLEQRGERLAVSTLSPGKNSYFRWNLTF
jgi:hypothetical protein